MALHSPSPSSLNIHVAQSLLSLRQVSPFPHLYFKVSPPSIMAYDDHFSGRTFLSPFPYAKEDFCQFPSLDKIKSNQEFLFLILDLTRDVPVDLSSLPCERMRRMLIGLCSPHCNVWRPVFMRDGVETFPPQPSLRPEIIESPVSPAHLLRTL